MRSEEESKCRCFRDCSDFQQIIKINNTGLVIYRYSSRIKEAVLKSGYLDKMRIDDVYIFHNTSNHDITTNKYFLELGQCIKCARCKYLVEHANQLLKKISHINKFGIISLCNFCQANKGNNILCSYCNEAVKKFIAYKNQNTKETGEYIQWVNNIKYFLEINKIHSRSYPELHLNKQRNFTLSPRLIHGPRTSQLQGFKTDSPTQMNNQHHYEYLLKSPERRDTIINHDLKTQLLVGKKLKHDNKQEYMQHFDENNELIEHSDVNFNRQRQKKLKFPSKYRHISQYDTNLNLHDFNLINFLQRKYSAHTISNYIDNNISIENITTPHSHTIGENLLPQKTKIKSVDLNSEKSLVNLDETVALGSLHKNFSFVFIKSKRQTKNAKISKSSTELIKDTQDLIRSRAEKDKKNQLKETKNNEIELFQIKKKTSQLKRKKQIEEKKNKNYLEEEKKLLEDEINKVKSDKLFNKKLTKKVSRLSLIVSKKQKSIKIKSEAEEQNYNKNVLKPEKELSKAKKEEEIKQKAEKSLIDKEQKPKDYGQKEKIQQEQQRKSKKQEFNYEESNEKDNIEKFKKILTEQKKQEKMSKKKEEQNNKIKEVTDKTTKQEGMLKIQSKETKLNIKSEFNTKTKTKLEDSEINKLEVNRETIKKLSTDDLILQLVKLKQSYPRKERTRPKRLSEIDIDPAVISSHKGHQIKKQPDCIICNDSELELDIENILNSQYESKDVTDIIIGQKILKYKPHILEAKIKKSTINPTIFMSTLQDDVMHTPKHNFFTNTAKGDVERKALSNKSGEQDIPKGIIRYALSDRTFIDKGWTMLPTEKVVRKMNVYRMRPAHPEFDWFEHNKNKKLVYYDSGEKLAEIDDNGRGRWFYRNGKLALDYYDAKEINAQQRFVIYSNGEPDERGRSRPLVILATFDYLGNGIVFDHAGKIRLKYNQTEGVVLDRSIGPVSHWKWHTLNDPPVLQQVMIDTQMSHKDPEILKLGGPADEKTRPENEEMLAIEFDNFIKEKSKKLTQKFKPFQIKMKALKINEHFSLKVLDQATIYLIFRDGSTNLKINIGMILDHQEIVDTDTAEVGEVSNSLERFPARTDSLAGLQKSVAYAQRVERARLEREWQLRPTKPCADKVNAVVSRPLRRPLHRVPSSAIVTSADYKCQCRKSSSCYLYYDTRLT